MVLPRITMACVPALPQPRRWTGVILVVVVLVWSASMTSAKISAVAALLTAAGVMVKRLS